MMPLSYFGVPVLVIADHGDGWVTARWPDRENPGRAHKARKPFTYEKGFWWKHWGAQLTEFAGAPSVEPPSRPDVLASKILDIETGELADPWVTVGYEPPYPPQLPPPPTAATADFRPPPSPKTHAPSDPPLHT